MRADPRQIGVGGEPAGEGLDKEPERLELRHDVIAEGKCLDATKVDISLSLRSGHLEAELVSAFEVEGLEMLDLGVSEQDSVVAEKVFWLVRRHYHIKGGV